MNNVKKKKKRFLPQYHGLAQYYGKSIKQDNVHNFSYLLLV